MVNDFSRTIDNGKVLRFLGAKKGKRVSVSVQHRIDSLTQKMGALIRPRLISRRLPLVSTDTGGIELGGGIRFRSPKLAKAVGKAEQICCFIATIGHGIDGEIKRLMKAGRYADAYVLDAIGSMSAENVVEQYYQRTAKKASKKNKGVTLRFSPGYCDWPLEQQQALFSLLRDHPSLDVTLNGNSLMSPRKSVSGLFGILPTGSSGVNPAYNPCTMCKKHDCIARRSH